MNTIYKRLDIYLAEKYNFSRQKAQEFIKSNRVFVNNKCISKSSFKISDEDLLFVDKPKIDFVGRGGFKLLEAFEVFDINVENKICLDLGASTGGFTDCLLQFGAKKVYAIDVGHSQMVDSILENPKVINIENKNVKDLLPSDFSEEIDFITIDLSFISLTKVLDKIIPLTEKGDIVCLIKPQFETENSNIKKGIVKSQKVHTKVLKKLYTYFVNLNINVVNGTTSPIKGQKGNIEFLIHLSKTKQLIDEKSFLGRCFFEKNRNNS